MFSTIKSIIKTLSILSLFTTLVVAGLSNVNVSAKSCPGYTQNFDDNAACPAPSRTAGSTGIGGTTADLTPNVCPGGRCPVFNNAGAANGLADRNAVSNFILNFAKFFIFIASAIAVLFIVYGGYLYISDGGDEKRSATGKKVLINALIGLAVCILSLTIVTFVGSTLEGNLVGSVVGG
jgi:Type IV secretion system pilin